MSPLSLAAGTWLAEIADRVRALVGAKDYDGADALVEITTVTLFEQGYAAIAAEFFASGITVVPARRLSALRRGYRQNLEGLLHLAQEDDSSRAFFLRALAVSDEFEDRALEALVSLNLGALAQQRDKEDEARGWYERGLEAALAAGAKSDALKIQLNMAYLDLSDGKLDETESRITSAVELSAAFWPRRRVPPQIDALNGHLSRRRGDLEAAEAAYRRALAGARREGRADLMTVAYQWLGAVSMERGKPGQALRNFRQALRLARQREEPSDIDLTARSLAGTLYQRGRSTEASHVLYQCRQLLRRMGAPVSWAHIVLEAALLDAELGEFRKADRALRSVIPTFVDWGATDWAVRGLRGLVRLAGRKKDRRTSLRTLKFIMGLSPRLGASLASEILGLLGREFALLGDETAGEAFRLSIDFARRAEAGDVPMLGAYAALALEAAGLFALALEMFDGADKESLARGDLAARTLILNDRGLLLVRMKRYADAEQSLADSQRLATTYSDRVADARANFNLAELYRRWDRLDDAERCARLALTSSQQRDDTAGVAEAFNQLALVLTDMQRYAEARQLFEEARVLAVSINAPHPEGQAIGGLARLAYLDGKYAAAAQSYSAASELNKDDYETTHYVEDLAGLLESYSAAHVSTEIRLAAQMLVTACQERGVELLGADSLLRAGSLWLRDDFEVATFLFALAIALAGLGTNSTGGIQVSMREVGGRMGAAMLLASESGVDVHRLRRRIHGHLNRLHRGLGKALEPLLDAALDAVTGTPETKADTTSA